MNTRAVVFALVLALFVSGCANLSGPPPVKALSLNRVAGIGKAGLFAVDPAGTLVALARSGLVLHDVASESAHRVSTEDPVALAWHPQGSVLAAVYPHGEEGIRVLQLSRQGDLLQESLLPVQYRAVCWTVRGELLVAGSALKVYSFGANLQQWLYRFGPDGVVEARLSDTTLKPLTARTLAPVLGQFLPVLFSPYGDELVFVSLHDPPEFAPYAEVVHYNWPASAQRSLLELPLQSIGMEPGRQADSVELVLEAGRTSLDVWPAVDRPRDPDDSLHFIGGRWYQGRELLADWGSGARLQRLGDGRFFAAVDRVLYQGDGLPVQAGRGYDEKTWTLRRWRASGLISPSEYRNLLGKESQ